MVKVDLNPSWSEIVIVKVIVFPPLEVVDESVAVLGGRRLELEVTVLVCVPIEVLGNGGLEVNFTEVVDVRVVVPRGGGLGMRVTGGTFGNVVFRAGHPEDPASRRTGQ